MELHVLIRGDKDLSGQIYRQLKEAIRAGRLVAGEKLPPSRLLAQQLGLSRKTVAEAYARLSYDKLILGRVGSGTFVADHAKRARPLKADAPLAGWETAERWQKMNTPLRHQAPEGNSRYEYIGGTPALALFPHEEWRRCVLDALRQGAKSRGLYGSAEGLPQLREAIARHAAFSRGVRCSAEDVIVTNGAQQALDLVARVLVVPGCTVAMEEPGYPIARLLLQAQGARVASVPVDSEGLVVSGIPDDTRLVYVTPAHQFPLGMSMSAGRREALLARAREIGAIIIEDDYDSEFRYEGRPTDSLQSMDDRGTVAFVGTFSKTLSPELRLGYLIAPPSILQAVATAKHLCDWHTPLLMQRALVKFMADGGLQRHIRRCYAEYAQRRALMLQRLDGDLSNWLTPVPANAGIHLTALCKSPIDMDLLLRLMRRVDVGVYSIDPFFASAAGQQGLMFGLGAISSEDIPPSLDRLRDVLQQMG